METCASIDIGLHLYNSEMMNLASEHLLLLLLTHIAANCTLSQLSQISLNVPCRVTVRISNGLSRGVSHVEQGAIDILMRHLVVLNRAL